MLFGSGRYLDFGEFDIEKYKTERFLQKFAKFFTILLFHTVILYQRQLEIKWRKFSLKD